MTYFNQDIFPLHHRIFLAGNISLLHTVGYYKVDFLIQILNKYLHLIEVLFSYVNGIAVLLHNSLNNLPIDPKPPKHN